MTPSPEYTRFRAGEITAREYVDQLRARVYAEVEREFPMSQGVPEKTAVIIGLVVGLGLGGLFGFAVGVAFS